MGEARAAAIGLQRGRGVGVGDATRLRLSRCGSYCASVGSGVSGCKGIGLWVCARSPVWTCVCRVWSTY